MLNKLLIFVNTSLASIQANQHPDAGEQQKTWCILTDTPHLISKIIKYGKYREVINNRKAGHLSAQWHDAGHRATRHRSGLSSR